MAALCPSPRTGVGSRQWGGARAEPHLTRPQQRLPGQGITICLLVPSEPHSAEKLKNNGANPWDLNLCPLGPGRTSSLFLPSPDLQVSGQKGAAVAS